MSLFADAANSDHRSCVASDVIVTEFNGA